jgi:hypothetical protein
MHEEYRNWVASEQARWHGRFSISCRPRSEIERVRERARELERQEREIEGEREHARERERQEREKQRAKNQRKRHNSKANRRRRKAQEITSFDTVSNFPANPERSHRDVGVSSDPVRFVVRLKEEVHSDDDSDIPVM